MTLEDIEKAAADLADDLLQTFGSKSDAYNQCALALSEAINYGDDVTYNALSATIVWMLKRGWSTKN